MLLLLLLLLGAASFVMDIFMEAFMIDSMSPSKVLKS